ncbi:glycosyltransferase family 2 protein [Streptomyces iconiensis]|uniref:Glycosyltransferase family 2 protein n=1 Tax=Streptomyces iconiensis TaxID=1384038 RepID=A0ABT7A977_9ACTN|nr:glycosyltransferase family 2 protein [Streptomyces iconiensis]MDJ1137912.1 glycosyltransferase family 2 protein [Streptomyces iconiensis]
MSSGPQVSVVIPYHPARAENGMLYRAMDSVSLQTVPNALVTVEDEQCQGAARTRQRGLEMVTTEWMAFLDSDDEMDYTHLEQLLACAEREHADYVYPWFRVAGGVDPFPMFFGRPWDDAAPHQTTITILVRTDLARQVGFTDVAAGPPPPDGNTGGEDWHFTLGCLAAGARIVHHPARTWTWHHGPQNSSGRPGRGDARTP